MSNRLAVAGGLCLVVGCGLLALNVYGMSRSLRSPLTAAEPSDFAHPQINEADETWQRLGSLDPLNRTEFAMEASRIIGEAMKHEPFSGSEAPSTSFADSHLVVPVWENYFLYAFSFLHPSIYRAYEFVDHRRAIERGIGQCGQQALAVVGFLETHGFNTGFADLSRHVVATAEVEPGTWYVLDPDFGLSIPHSVEELAADQSLVESYYATFNNAGSDLYRYPWLVYSEYPPVVTYGGIRTRRPRGSLIEPAAYLAKWFLPFLLILVGGIGVRLRPGRSLRRAQTL